MSDIAGSLTEFQHLPGGEQFLELYTEYLKPNYDSPEELEKIGEELEDLRCEIAEDFLDGNMAEARKISAKALRYAVYTSIGIEAVEDSI